MSPSTGHSQPKLSLPQYDSAEERAARNKGIAERAHEYEFRPFRKGYPPFIKKVPSCEKPLQGYFELGKSGIMMVTSSVRGWFDRLRLGWESLFKQAKPFEQYEALYEHRGMPDIGVDGRWMKDELFASQRLNGMYPWYIRGVEDLDEFLKDFPITDQRLAGLLPEGVTLEDLYADHRLYYVSQPGLYGAPGAHGHVMTAPTTLFWVNTAGQLMPLGIQLYPDPSLTNPIFTPNDDPGTWLAMKIHVCTADSLVHAVYSHSILMHFVMSGMWISANQALSVEHPVHAFLKPHFWSTLLITNLVEGTMNKPDSGQTKVYGTGLIGQDHLVSKLYEEFDFADYDPHIEFAKRRIDDPEKLPHFYYRDDALRIWDADRAYVEEMISVFYYSDDDVRNDDELQAWMVRAADQKDGAGIKGLPVGPSGRLETRGQLVQILTSILFTVSSRHSSIENGGLKYLYVPANPFIYQLSAPKDASVKMTMSQVSQQLPPLSLVVATDALVSAANFKAGEFGQLGVYADDFMAGAPDAVRPIIESWQNELLRITKEINERNLKNPAEIPYTGVRPDKTFNSIWN